MKKTFIVYGTAICLVFFFATYRGWTISNSLKSSKWGPQEHNSYHK